MLRFGEFYWQCNLLSNGINRFVASLITRENDREEANNKLVTENKQETKMVPVFSQQSQMLFNSITKN